MKKETIIFKQKKMFEKEIQFITDFNLNRIKKLGSSFTFNKLFEAEIHPALIKYISGRIDYLIHLDRKILLENSDFDYSGAKISDYFNLIANEIRNTKKLSYNEIKKYIEEGVIFNANFTIQPKTALTHLIYRYSEEAKSTAEIKVFLNYLYYYDYLRAIIVSYISKRKLVNLSRSEFKSLLDKIDGELTAADAKNIISDALTSISDFYNDGGLSKTSIQPALIESFLIEKNLDGFNRKLSSVIKDNKKKINVEEIKKILFTKKATAETQVEMKEKKINKEDKPIILSEKEVLTKPEWKEKVKEIDFPDKEIYFEEEMTRDKDESEMVVEKSGKNEEGIYTEVEKSEDEEQKFIEELRKDKEKKEAEEPEKDEEEKYIEEIEKDEEQIVEEKPGKEDEIKEKYSEEFKVDAEEENNYSEEQEKNKVDETLLTDFEETEFNEHVLEEEIFDSDIGEAGSGIDIEEIIEEYIPVSKESIREKDIFSFLSKKEIDKIISVIFNDDGDDFANTVEKISECRNYEQASEILKSVFLTYHTNPYTREAVTLTNAVSNYFHQV